MVRARLRFGALAAAAALLPIVGTAPASAGGIVVNAKTMLLQDDGTCTLPEAIKAANTDTASGVSSGECSAGAGADTITFSVTGTILTTRLPDVATPTTIDGAGKVTLNAQQSSGFFIVSGNPVTLRGLVFTKGRSQYGGAMLVANTGNLTVDRSTISSNIGVQGGGINVANNGTLALVDSTIAGNTASGTGGGVQVGAGADVVIERSTISGNRASHGGGIHTAGTLFLTNSTVAGNTAVATGGGVYANTTAAISIRNATIALNGAASTGGFYGDLAASTEVGNTIIAGNTHGNVGGQIDVQTKNILGGSVSGLLDPNGLQANGGPTKTIKLLATAAAALDDGSTGLCGGSPVDNTDQRGVLRGSPCDIGAVERDRSAPTTTAPVTHLRSGTNLSGTAMRAVVRWTGADADGKGIARFQLQRSVNGGAYTTISSTLTGTSASVTLANGSSYRFRVRAVDRDGNVGSYATGAAGKSSLVQNQSSAITYNGSWPKATSDKFSGGTARSATQTDDEQARYFFTGSSVAFVTTTGPNRGVVDLYVDGKNVGKLDLYSSTVKYRQVLYAATWATPGSHSLWVSSYGALGRTRVDVDAFAVIK